MSHQLLCLTAHYPQYQHIRELVHKSAMHVMNSGGVVRNIDYWGTKALPQHMRRHKLGKYSVADYWLMYYVSSPKTSQALDHMMRTDARVVKWSILKLGHRPEDMVDTGEKTVYRHKRLEIGLEMEKRLEKAMEERVREEM